MTPPPRMQWGRTKLWIERHSTFPSGETVEDLYQTLVDDIIPGKIPVLSRTIFPLRATEHYLLTPHLGPGTAFSNRKSHGSLFPVVPFKKTDCKVKYPR